MDDFEAIRQLSARYNLAFDFNDVETYIGLWVEDGFFERSNAGRGYRGHAELREQIADFDVDGRHLTTNFIIEVEGDRATQSAYLTYIDKDGGFEVMMFGVYSDELVRTADGWKFASRRLRVDD